MKAQFMALGFVAALFMLFAGMTTDAAAQTNFYIHNYTNSPLDGDVVLDNGQKIPFHAPSNTVECISIPAPCWVVEVELNNGAIIPAGYAGPTLPVPPPYQVLNADFTDAWNIIFSC